MATKKKQAAARSAPQVGDDVIWYGYRLKVTHVNDKIAKVSNQDEEDILAARDRILELRKEQVKLKKEDGVRHAEIHNEVTQLAAQAQTVIVKAGLRVDLLSWWEEEQAWAADGRVLSDDQKKKWVEVTGSRNPPAVDQQRAARTLLKKLDVLEDPKGRFVPAQPEE